MKFNIVITLMLILINSLWATNEISNCSIINSSGDYTIVNDIRLDHNDGFSLQDALRCIFVNSSDVNIDLNGHTLSCSDNSSIFFTVGNNMSLENGKIENCDEVVDSDNALSNAQNLTIVNDSYGLYSENTTDSTFINNSFALVPAGGPISNASVSNNNFQNNYVAISCATDGCSGMGIVNNVFEDNFFAIQIYGTETSIPRGIIIAGNTFANNNKDCEASAYSDFTGVEDNCNWYFLFNNNWFSLKLIGLGIVIIFILILLVLKLNKPAKKRV